jgi:hypothetical protein
MLDEALRGDNFGFSKKRRWTKCGRWQLEENKQKMAHVGSHTLLGVLLC